MSTELQSPAADLHLQDEEKRDQMLKKHRTGNRMPSLLWHHDIIF
jgi:hypothetical protein